MKKIYLLMLLALAVLTITLNSCETKDNVLGNQSQDSVPSTTSPPTNEAVEPTYNYDGVAKLHDYFQQFSSLITTDLDFRKSMWELSKYSDDKEVHDDFTFYGSKNNATKTISDSVSVLSKAMETELTNCDPSLAPLLQSVSDKYAELAEFLINPSGAYKDYLEAFDSCFDEYVFAFDEMTAYLYEVGYYTE